MRITGFLSRAMRLFLSWQLRSLPLFLAVFACLARYIVATMRLARQTKTPQKSSANNLAPKTKAIAVIGVLRVLRELGYAARLFIFFYTSSALIELVVLLVLLVSSASYNFAVIPETDKPPFLSQS